MHSLNQSFDTLRNHPFQGGFIERRSLKRDINALEITLKTIIAQIQSPEAHSEKSIKKLRANIKLLRTKLSDVQNAYNNTTSITPTAETVFKMFSEIFTSINNFIEKPSTILTPDQNAERVRQLVSDILKKNNKVAAQSSAEKPSATSPNAKRRPITHTKLSESKQRRIINSLIELSSKYSDTDLNQQLNYAEALKKRMEDLQTPLANNNELKKMFTEALKEAEKRIESLINPKKTITTHDEIPQGPNASPTHITTLLTDLGEQYSKDDLETQQAYKTKILALEENYQSSLNKSDFLKSLFATCLSTVEGNITRLTPKAESETIPEAEIPQAAEKKLANKIKKFLTNKDAKYPRNDIKQYNDYLKALEKILSKLKNPSGELITLKGTIQTLHSEAINNIARLTTEQLDKEILTLTSKKPNENDLTAQKEYKRQLQDIMRRVKGPTVDPNNFKTRIQILLDENKRNMLESEIHILLSNSVDRYTEKTDIPYLIAYKKDLKTLMTQLENSPEGLINLKAQIKTQLDRTKEILKNLTCRGPESIKGIRNVGNSCYMNALFQAIYACPQLREAFFLPLVQNEDESIDDFETRKKIQDIGADILSTLSSDNTVTNINDFRDAIVSSSLNTGLEARTQEDPTELFDIFDSLFDIKNRLKLSTKSEMKTLEGDITSVSEDECLAINLNIFQADSLEEALAQFSRNEPVPNRISSVKIKKAPQMLPIILGRSDTSLTQKKVTIPIELTLPSDMFTESHEQGVQYRLKSVVCHHGGSLDSGHYTSYRRNSQGELLHYNDDHVSKPAESTLQRHLENNGYMFFYERVE